MEGKQVLQIGDPRLKAENRKVTDIKSPQTAKILKDLIKTMRVNELIGIAAPQIGINYRIFVTEPRKTKFRKGDQVDNLRVYINPKIINYSEQKNLIYEGCGSVVYGKLFGPVIRPKDIIIEALDENGQKFKLFCDGILARVIQHEYDHLKGVEFTEKISDYTKIMEEYFYIKYIKNSPAQRQASVITKKDLIFG